MSGSAHGQEIGRGGAGGVLAAALYAARLGWPVFPLRPGGKVPAIRAAHPAGHPCRGECGRYGHGFRDATTDPAVISGWWQAMPAANYGIATGPTADSTGLVVIDLDTPKLTGPAGQVLAGPVRRPPQLLPDHDPHAPGDLAHPGGQGEATPPEVGDGAGVLAWAAARDGARLDLSGTLAILTPSGGRHLYYAAPEAPVISSSVGTSGGRVSGLGWLVDVRAAGGYVVGPGSITPAGRYYRAPGAAAGPAELPGWLLRRLLAHHHTRSAAVHPSGGPADRPCMAGDAGLRPPAGRPTRAVGGYAGAALAGELAHIAAAVAGDTGGAGRNVTVNRAAYKLGRIVDACALAAGQVDELAARLIAAGIAVGLPEREARTAVASGLAHGRAHPRPLPPPPPRRPPRSPRLTRRP